MKFRKIAVGLSVIALTNAGAPTIRVFANEVNKSFSKVEINQQHTSSMKKFDIESNKNFEQYKEQFKIQNELIESVSANGGKYGSSVPERAIDEDIKTHWETGKPNSESFTNEFVVVFKDIVNIDKITYKVRQDSGTKGFLNNYEIYASKTVDGEDFTLVTKGTGKSTKDTVEINFNETEAKRIKIRFVGADANWSSMSEVGFYKKDVVRDSMSKLFTDSTNSQVSEEYRDINKLNELENIAKEHPFYNDYKNQIEDAKILIENDKITQSEAKTKLFEHYNNSDYNEVFKMDNSNIESIKNNAGTNSGKPITYAIDEDMNTAWESNTVNSDSFTNEVEITFKDRVVLNRVIYGARQNDSRGFAEEFEIYASNTTQGDTYQLVATGAHDKVRGLIEAKFEPTEFKRIKFKFKKSNQNWATASEFAFYTQDEVSDKVDRLFTDDTLSVVSEEFNSIEKVEALEQQAKEHPLYNDFKESIENAKELVLKSEVKYSDAKISKFELANNEAYNNEFKMDNSNIKSIKSNAGTNLGKPISYAIDGDLSTAWESNAVNSDSFTNEVEIEFIETVELNRLVYGARAEDGRGFAEEFEIYASTTTTGDTYELVSVGKYNTTKDMIEAQFEPTKFRRVKFKFKKSNKNWATAREFVFYKEDKLRDEINNMFVDKTYSQLKEEYKNINKINELEKQVMKHPLKDELMKNIELAKTLLHGDVDYSQTTIVANQHGDMAGHARKNLEMTSAGQNFQATGFYVLPGDEITVYLDIDSKNGKMPKIKLTQNEGSWRKWASTIQLHPGENKITVPDIYDESIMPTKPKSGGAILIENPYTPEEQGSAPIIRIEGAQRFPFYKEGDDEEEFKAFLEEYKKKLDEDDKSGANKVLDILAVESDRMLISGTATGGYETYIKKGVNPSETTTVWDEYMDEVFRFYGLDGSSELHDPKNLKEHIMVAQPYGGLYAWTDHVGVHKSAGAAILDPKVIKGSWGYAHEIGHRMDTDGRVWGEVTNNMISMQMPAYYGVNSSNGVEYNTIYKKAAPDVREDLYENGRYFESLGMFWQLQLYNKDYWAEINKLYRERKPSSQIVDYQHKMDLFIEYSSEVLDRDLTNYFYRHGFRASEETKNKLASMYKPLEKKVWYLNDSVYNYKGNGISQDSEPKIHEVASDGKITISSDINKEDLLGYEIIRDGEIIGFTSSNTFKDDSKIEGIDYEYQVVAYGKDLSTSSISEKISTLTPTIRLQQSNVYIGLGEEFNPLDYVKVLNNNGQEINDKLKIVSNVDTSKKGEYEVKYVIEDNNITVEKTMIVNVVSEVDYLSDREWENVETQYGNPRRNTNIKGRVNGEIQGFEKGIGIHANGKIEYNLEGTNYDNFEALLGVDMSIESQDRSSITFKVLGDGEVLATTNVLKHSDNMVHINVPVKGVKKLTIEVYDGGNGNSSDHSIIANPKLTNNNLKPSLDISDNNVSLKIGTEYDLLANVTAKDTEDGDLTNNIKVEDGGFNPNKSGKYTITYTVADSDNNTVTKTREILVYSDVNYASDIDWVSATSGWKTVNKDKAVGSNNKIKLNVDGDIVEFDKGIGVATNSEIVYNLEGKGYDYFTTYLGTDKNYSDSRTTIDFKILADGKEIYTSETIKRESKAEFVSLDIRGVKELKLIANDHDGNGIGDFASWADTKLYTTNSKPSLQIPDSVSIKVGENIEDVIGEFRAVDIEDGDLTDKVVVSGYENMNFNKPGKYKITYSVTDTDGNTVSKERSISIIDMRDFNYLTDYDWTSAKQSYSTTKKDTNISGDRLRLTDQDGSEVAYDRGIGSHATATIIYDLSDKNYEYFTSYVGVDRVMYNRPGSVSFEVHVDGEKKYDSGLMNATDSQKFVEVNISNAKELKLIVKDGGNGNGSDHATWGDAKLHFVNSERADLTSLIEAIEKAESIDASDYTEESINNLNLVVNEAKELLNADFVSQAQCEEAIKSIEEAINKLEVLDKAIVIQDKVLEQEIKSTLNIDDREITLADMHKLVSLECTSGYVTSLSGLEYAVNLESLNIDFNEVCDISSIRDLKKLKNFSGKENFISNSNDKVLIEDEKFIIEDAVIDADGERLLPTEVVLSPNVNPIKLDLEEVLVGNKVVIDSSLIEDTEAVEILYESKTYDYQLYTFTFLKK